MFPVANTFPLARPDPNFIPKDLERILALPTRTPVDCERERGSRRWAPAAQALVEVMTEKLSRGKRLSCGCRNRKVALVGNTLLVGHEPRPSEVPPLPIETTVAAFCRDNAHNTEACRIVNNLRSGDSAEIPGFGRLYCITELNPVQAWILRELPKAQGIFGMISVGGGKSYAGILAPLVVPNAKTVVLLAKPDQRLHYRNAYLHLREHFHVPSIVFDTRDLKGSYIVPGTPVLHFVPYTLLSSPKSTTLLEQLNPDMVIADESHLLASRVSSRTTRFLRFMAKRQDVIFCNWSGSTIKKSMKDAAHLSAHALGLGSPYPIVPDEVEAWSAVIDPSPIPDCKSTTAVSLKRAFGTKNDLEKAFFVAGLVSNSGVREGFRERVVRTSGVVSTESSSVNCSVSIKERKAPELPSTVREALVGVRNEAVRPDGEELVEALEIAVCARTVAAGFHFYWAFPKGEPEEVIEDWFAKRKAWNKELRAKLRYGEPHLDSPLLCANAAERAWRKQRYDGDLPVWPAEAWPAWSKIKDKVEPEPRVKWIDDFLARDAAAWAQEHRGIVWCQSSAFGKKVAELAGINYHGGGLGAESKILDEDGSKSIVASIKAHGTGRDGLQYKFNEQLIAEILSSGDGWEQLLGRLCREGQAEDTVMTEVYIHVHENKDAMRKAIEYAEFIEATTPNRQLLLAADIEFDL